MIFQIKKILYELWIAKKYYITTTVSADTTALKRDTFKIIHFVKVLIIMNNNEVLIQAQKPRSERRKISETFKGFSF